MCDTNPPSVPSRFVTTWLARLRFAELAAEGRALDVAMGWGRHSLALAQAGFRTFGVDINLRAVTEGVHAARRQRLPVNGWCADLTRYPLPRTTFDVVLVTCYLQRDLFPAIRAAPSHGRFVIYETFTTEQRGHGRGPTSADHLLEPGELLERFRGFDVEFYEEVREPDAMARIVARRRP